LAGCKDEKNAGADVIQTQKNSLISLLEFLASQGLQVNGTEQPSARKNALKHA
jgi:hypothetical protein